MGRSSNRKKNNRIKFEAKKTITNVIDKKDGKSKLSNLWDSISAGWKVFGTIVLIGSGVLTYIQLYDRIFPPETIIDQSFKNEAKSPKERFKNNNIDTGYLQGPLIFNDYSPEKFLPIKTRGIYKDSMPNVKGILIKNASKTGISLKFGTNIVTLTSNLLLNGFKVSSGDYTPGCYGYDMFFGVKNDRLYVSLKFRSFDSSNLIGFIEFNKWKLFLDNILDYDSDDKRLEVRDKPQGNIVFSLKYEDSNNGGIPVVSVSGYFVTNIGVIVINDDGEKELCFSKSDIASRSGALKRMRNTKSIF